MVNTISASRRGMEAILRSPVKEKNVWTGANFAVDDRWVVTFSAEDLRELRDAVSYARRRNAHAGRLSTEDFPLPGLAPKLADCLQEVEYGRGFVLLRGISVDEYSGDDSGLLFRGIGAQLGTAISQNAKGDLLGHVRDVGYSDYRGRTDIRGYQTRAGLEFHTDGCDVVGLMCIRSAKEGGESLIVSSTTIYNEILKISAAHLGLLYGTYLFDRRGEEQAGEAPFFTSPIYSVYSGVVSCGVGVIDYIWSAEEKVGIRLSDAQREAINLFVDQTLRPELHLSMSLRPGDIQLLNNSVILHSRTGFVDHDEPDRRRHLLRLWLNVENARPVDRQAFTRRRGVPTKSQVELS